MLQTSANLYCLQALPDSKSYGSQHTTYPNPNKTPDLYVCFYKIALLSKRTHYPQRDGLNENR
jgi:hypothetical protein